jgi:hypothetical protein
MWHVWGGKYTGFCWESPKERDHLEDESLDRRMGSEWILLAGGGCGVDTDGSG